MSLSPPPIPIPAAKNRFRDAAKASWLAPLLAIGINFAILAGQGGKAQGVNYVQMVLASLLILGGLIAGIVALFGIRRHGSRGILVPALAGILVNLLLVAGALQPLLLARRGRAQLEPAIHSSTSRLVKHEGLRFSLDIPGDFRDYPEGKRTPAMEYVFVRGLPDSGEPLEVINIERLNGILPRNKPLSKVNLPAGFSGHLTNRNWRGVKVDTFVASIRQNGVSMVAYTMQIPLTPMAIQISVGGSESKREEIEMIADALLASLEGETNW